MGGQQRLDVQLFHLLKAGEIVLQRIFRAQLNTDIGCDGAENVVAAEEEFLLGVIEAHMPRRMPRRLHSL